MLCIDQYADKCYLLVGEVSVGFGFKSAPFTAERGTSPVIRWLFRSLLRVSSGYALQVNIILCTPLIYSRSYVSQLQSPKGNFLDRNLVLD